MCVCVFQWSQKKIIGVLGRYVARKLERLGALVEGPLVELPVMAGVSDSENTDSDDSDHHDTDDDDDDDDDEEEEDHDGANAGKTGDVYRAIEQTSAGGESPGDLRVNLDLSALLILISDVCNMSEAAIAAEEAHRAIHGWVWRDLLIDWCFLFGNCVWL